MNEIVTAISTLGFPIIACVMLGYILIEEQKNHKEEMMQLKDAIHSNTIIMTELKQLLEDIRKGA